MLDVNEALVANLLAEQMSALAGLPVQAVAKQGWDNRSFRVGGSLVARLPSHAAYAAQVLVEQRWLPVLAAHVPLEIPRPIALGAPGCGYPWAWSLRRWIEGEAASGATTPRLDAVAVDLAKFLNALRQVPTAGAPQPGAQNFHRGGGLQGYDPQLREALTRLGSRICADDALSLWENALASPWVDAPVWVHGDIAPGNLLLRQGKLAAVIDFGQTCVGDPACDCAIAWTSFSGAAREAFRQALALDEATWLRGKAWALWKAAVVVAGVVQASAPDAERAQHALAELLKLTKIDAK